MSLIYLTNAQFGYIHLYACALHGLPEPMIAMADYDGASVSAELSHACGGLLGRIAERLFLLLLNSGSEVQKTPFRKIS